MSTRNRRLALLACIILTSSQTTMGLDVTLNYVSPLDNPDSVVVPFDPNVPGVFPPPALTLLMGYTAGYYEDIIGDAHDLTINYWYEDLDGNNLGFNSIVATDIPGDPARKVIEANIRIDSRIGSGGDYRDWFIDCYARGLC